MADVFSVSVSTLAVMLSPICVVRTLFKACWVGHLVPLIVRSPSLRFFNWSNWLLCCRRSYSIPLIPLRCWLLLIVVATIYQTPRRPSWTRTSSGWDPAGQASLDALDLSSWSSWLRLPACRLPLARRLPGHSISHCYLLKGWPREQASTLSSIGRAGTRNTTYNGKALIKSLRQGPPIASKIPLVPRPVSWVPFPIYALSTSSASPHSRHRNPLHVPPAHSRARFSTNTGKGTLTHCPGQASRTTLSNAIPA